MFLDKVIISFSTWLDNICEKIGNLVIEKPKKKRKKKVCKNCHCNCHCKDELHLHHYDSDLCICDNCKH